MAGDDVTMPASSDEDALERRLEEDYKQFAASFLDIKLILTNHNERITALERRPKRRA